MPRPKADPMEAKLKRQQRNQRYLAKSGVKERIRERDRLYQLKKREQARRQLCQNPLAQMADIVTQQRYLEVETDDIPEAPAIREPAQEEESIDVGVIVEEDGEIAENFVRDQDGEWDGVFDRGFPDEPETDGDWGLDGGFPDEPESDVSDGFDGGFPDEPESDGNDSFDGDSSNESEWDINDDGSQSMTIY
jgi:hypothetical protein